MISQGAANFIQDLVNEMHDRDQDREIAKHRKHIQAIWRHLERLERIVEVNGDNEAIFRCGNASITLKKNGDVTIRGGNIVIDGASKVTVKAAGNLVLKGNKINDN